MRPLSLSVSRSLNRAQVAVYCSDGSFKATHVTINRTLNLEDGWLFTRYAAAEVAR